MIAIWCLGTFIVGLFLGLLLGASVVIGAMNRTASTPAVSLKREAMRMAS